MDILRTEHENIRILASRELNKFGIKFKLKKLPSKKRVAKKKCYGVALEHLITVDVDIDHKTIPIPKVFYDLISFVRNDNLDEEGIFRKVGSKVRERILVRMLNSGYPIPEETLIIDACTVIKLLIRNIPGRLVPKDITPWFLEAGKLDRDSSEEALNLCILLLPLENLYLTIFLIQFFNEVTLHSAQNKMNSYNLAVVIAPNIFALPSNVSLATESAIATQILTITKTLIEISKGLGEVPIALLNKLEDLHEEKASRKTLCTWLLNRLQLLYWHNIYWVVHRPTDHRKSHLNFDTFKYWLSILRTLIR